MRKAALGVLLAAAQLGAFEGDGSGVAIMPPPPMDPPDIRAAKRVQNTLGLEVAIPNPCSTPTLLVKLKANEIRRFSGNTWELAADKAIAALKPIVLARVAKARRSGMADPGVPPTMNRRMRRAQKAIARKAGK